MYLVTNSLILPSSHQRQLPYLDLWHSPGELVPYDLLNLVFSQLIIILLIYCFYLHLSLIPYLFYIFQASENILRCEIFKMIFQDMKQKRPPSFKQIVYLCLKKRLFTPRLLEI